MNEFIARPTSRTAAAHRRGGLRFGLAVLGSLQAGAIFVVVSAWTPLRAALAGVTLGLGALAALVAVILLGTRRPIGPLLGGALTVAVVGGLVGPALVASVDDQGQARAADLELTVRCAPSLDMQAMTASVEFEWHRTDVGTFFGPAAGTDILTITAELPEFMLAELSRPSPSYGPPQFVGVGSATGYWSAYLDPSGLTLDGRPSALWVAASADQADWTGSGSLTGLLGGGSSSEVSLYIDDASLRPGARYGATWTFGRGPAAEAMALDELLPFFVAEYQHGQRFTVQAYASCGEPNRSWPNRAG